MIQPKNAIDALVYTHEWLVETMAERDALMAKSPVGIAELDALRATKAELAAVKESLTICRTRQRSLETP
jgi:hypothetical protein